MTDHADLWSDEINAFVDRAFDSGIVSRNPSDAEEHIAYRYAIKLAIDETRQPQTDALKVAREVLHYAEQGFRVYVENIDHATATKHEKGYAMSFMILAKQCSDALAALKEKIT